MARTRSGRETSRTYVCDEGWLYLAVVTCRYWQVNVATHDGVRNLGTASAWQSVCGHYLWMAFYIRRRSSREIGTMIGIAQSGW